MPKPLSPVAQAMQAKGLLSNKNELLLYGVIGDWWDGVDALTIVRELEALDTDTIVVRIHSPGGSVTEGLAMYNSLRAAGKPVHVFVDGLCASIATVIAMAADKGHLYTPDNALWMVHKAHAVVHGNDDELRDHADAMSTVNESMIAAYIATGRVSEERVREIFATNKDFYMNGAEAVREGFADTLVASVKAAAQIDMSKLAAPQGAHKALYEFYAVNAAPTPQATHEEPSMKLQQLIALMAALTVQGIAAAEINGALAKVLGCDAKDVDATLSAKDKLKEDQIQAALDALAVLGKPAALVPTAEDPQAAVVAERRRVAEINALAQKHNLPAATRDELIAAGASIELARAKALDFLASADSRRQPLPGVRVVHVEDGQFRAAMTNALLHRMAPSAFKLEEAALEFRGLTLLDMARACLQQGGIDTRRMSRAELAATALNTTSDFPYIVQDVANKVLLNAYQMQPRTFTAVATQATASDFKAKHAIEIGGGGELKQVLEHGEFEMGSVSESKRSYKLETFGRIFAFSRQLLINDDIGAFNRFMSNVGALAARKESSVMWSLVKAANIFSAGNGNLVSGGGAVSDTQLDKVRQLLRKQKGLDGEPLNLTGKFLVVNSARETEAQKALSAIMATKEGEVNPFSNSLQLIVEPLLDGESNNPWYVFADPNLAPTLEFAYLEGESGPYIETQQGFEVDGIKIKVRHDFGGGFVSHRGVVKNPGA